MIRPPEVIEEGIVRKLVRVVVEQCIPAAIAAGLPAAQRYDYITLVPLNVVIEKQYGGYAMLLAAIGAFVAAFTFTRGGRRFGVVAFLFTTLFSMAMLSPFVLTRYGIHAGLTPMQLSLVSTYAFLGFAVTVGLLIGGSWAIVVRSFRDPGHAY